MINKNIIIIILMLSIGFLFLYIDQYKKLKSQMNKEKVIQTLNKHNISKIKVDCFDKGALDYTIKSRLETALQRGGYIE